MTDKDNKNISGNQKTPENKTYHVWLTKSIDVCVTVNAENEEEATKKALEKFWSLTPEERAKDEDIDTQSGKYEYSYIEED